MAILTNIFYRTRTCLFFSTWHEKHAIQQLKA
jgi:hypothetical protein